MYSVYQFIGGEFMEVAGGVNLPYYEAYKKYQSLSRKYPSQRFAIGEVGDGLIVPVGSKEGA